MDIQLTWLLSTPLCTLACSSHQYRAKACPLGTTSVNYFMHSPPSMPGNSNNQALLSNWVSPQGNNQEPFSQVITASTKKNGRKMVNPCLCSRGPVHGTCQRWSFFLDLLVNATTEVCLWEAQWPTRQTSSKFSISFFLPSSLAKNMRGVRTNKHRRHQKAPKVTKVDASSPTATSIDPVSASSPASEQCLQGETYM